MPGVGFSADIQKIEVAKIAKALDDNHGVIASAARDLRLNRTTLHEKMKKLGISK